VEFQLNAPMTKSIVYGGCTFKFRKALIRSESVLHLVFLFGDKNVKAMVRIVKKSSKAVAERNLNDFLCTAFGKR